MAILRLIAGPYFAPDGRPIHPADLLRSRGPRLPILVHVPIAIEEQLAREGKPIPPGVSGEALVDTGATSTSIDRAILADKLGLHAIGRESMLGAHGAQGADVFACDVIVPGHERQTLARTVSVNLQGSGLMAIVGRDFLAGKLMIYDGLAGVVSITW